jgi:hypothetical protein
LRSAFPGIQQFGGSFWVEPLFNGLTLLVAIGIAGYAQRKKGAARSESLSAPREETMLKRTFVKTLLAGTVIAGLGLPMAQAQMAWDGPTTGPKAAEGKTIVVLAADLKNGGILGVTNGVEEAAEKIGWDGARARRRRARSRAAPRLRPGAGASADGIIINGFDASRTAGGSRGRREGGHSDGVLAFGPQDRLRRARAAFSRMSRPTR